MGKNLKTLIPKTAVSKYPEPCAPNDELQLDFAGPLFANSNKSTYILVAIDSYSRFPSAMITKSTGTNKIIKFLKEYIALHGLPRAIKSDQFKSFKSDEMKRFCKGLGIEQRFCPVDDHRGCGRVERCIQTIKRRLGTCLINKKNFSLSDALNDVLFSIRTTKNSMTKQSPFERHFNRKPNTLLSNALQNFLDKKTLERSLLTPDDRKLEGYSKYRIKVVKPRENSKSVNFLYPKPQIEDLDAAAKDTLCRVASALEQWDDLTSSLNGLEKLDLMTSTTNKVTRIRNTIKNFNKHGLASDIDVPRFRRTLEQKAQILA